MKPKFKKGDKIYFDGPYGRAIWKILDVIEGMGRASGTYYFAQMIEKCAKGWKKRRNAFHEEVRVVDPDFRLLVDAPTEWKPCKDPMPGLLRMLRPL